MFTFTKVFCTEQKPISNGAGAYERVAIDYRKEISMQELSLNLPLGVGRAYFMCHWTQI